MILAIILVIVGICIGSRIREKCITARLKRLPVIYNDVRDVLQKSKPLKVEKISRDEIYSIEKPEVVREQFFYPNFL